VLDWLKANGLEEDTIVIYSSDQGFFTGEHGFFDKRLMHEPSTRMPLVVRAPGVTQAGSESRALASNIDFAPTLLELAGIRPNLSASEKFDGASLVPLLRREIPNDWRTAVYYRYWEHNSGEHPVPNNYGIRTATHKIICYQGQPHGMRGASKIATPEEWELFDLVKDPDEMVNVYNDPAYADVRKTLTAQLKAERERNGDTR
jgi:arylsulfatase A-like enzyme